MNFTADKILWAMKALCVIGIALNIIMMFIKGKELAKKDGFAEQIKAGRKPKNFIATSIVGFVANFFDTLGIGSFAPSSSAFKLTQSVDDLYIPGTLNVGDTIPVCLEAFLFFDAFNVDPLTCFLMCLVATVGAFIGAGIVSSWDRQGVRLGFGIGLFVLAVIMLCKQAKIGPFGAANIEYGPEMIGQLKDGLMFADVNGVVAAVGLRGMRLVIALVVNFFLGALMCIGVGLYAPCMALCVLIGLHTGMAFPLMMGSCAYLMAFGNGPKFIMEGRYDIVACWTQAIFGGIGVFVAYYIVKSLPLTVLTWLVIIVCFITSVLYFNDYYKEARKAQYAKRGK